MKPIRAAAATVFVAVALALVPAAVATAHPLGNFTVNRYAGIVVGEGRIRVNYVLDMAEIPTFQEMARIDGDGDGTAEAGERSAWADKAAARLGARIALEVQDRPVALEPGPASMALLPGVAGLQTLRLEVTFAGSAPVSGDAVFSDDNDPNRIGWREITAVGTGDTAVVDGSVPTTSVSDALRAYPRGLLSDPVDVRLATFSFGPGVQRSFGPAGSFPTSDRPATSDLPVANLVARPDLSLSLVALSLALAIGMGALHALAPGHGKTVMAAYVVGAGARLRDAVGAGAAVAAMHTVSVLGVGMAVLFAQRLFPPEAVYPWLTLAAGLVVTGLGVGLLVVRGRAVRRDRAHGHEHPHLPPAKPVLSRRGLAALAVSGGLLPAPSAVVVLLGAVALHRVAFGLGLILAFSAGLAAALAVVAAAAMRARDTLGRRLRPGLVAVLPVIGAAAILVVGLVLTGTAAARL